MNEFFIALEVRLRVETEADMKAACSVACRRAAAMRSSPGFRIVVDSAEVDQCGYGGLRGEMIPAPVETAQEPQ